jgi:hypothetical protein
VIELAAQINRRRMASATAWLFNTYPQFASMKVRQTMVRRLHDPARHQQTMTDSRFAVCMIGEAFSVEDKKTGERLGYYRTQAAAEKARDAFSRLYKNEIENGGQNQIDK